ncbi:MAG: O-antigen ligase family protein [Actinomycetes bacterium]
MSGVPADGKWPLRASVGFILILVSALAVLPGASEPYPLIKAAVAGLGAALVLSTRRTLALPGWISLLLGAGAAVLLLSALTSVTPLGAVFGRYPRYEGVWVAAVYLGALAAGARARAWPAARTVLERTLSVAAIVAAVVAIYQQIAPHGLHRVESVFGNANELGAWAVIVAIVLVPRALDRNWLAISGLTAAVATIGLSASRGAILGLVVGLAFLLIFAYRSRKGLWVAAIALGACALALLLPATRSRLIGADSIASHTAQIRWYLWGDSLTLIREHPLFGVGPSGFVDGIGRAHSPQWAAAVGPSNPPDSPHNLILQILSAGGLLLAAATIALVVVWVLAARRAWARDRDSVLFAIAALVAIVVSLLTHFTSPATVPLAAVLAGWVVATPPRSATEGRRAAASAARWSSVVAVGVSSIVLFTAAFAEYPIASALKSTAKGNFAAADSSWQLAHELRPWDGDLWLRQGHAQSVVAAKGKTPANACLDATARAVELLPTSSEAALDRARCLEVSGDYRAALTVLSTTRQSDPNNIDVVLLAGVVSAEAGDLNHAEDLFLEATRLSPDSRAPWLDLAVVYTRMGRPADATRARDRADHLSN